MVVSDKKILLSKANTAITVISLALILVLICTSARIVFTAFSVDSVGLSFVTTSLNPMKLITMPLITGTSGAADSDDGSEKAEIIRLHKKNVNDSEPFSVNQMLPGDKVSKEYTVVVNHHDDVDLTFSVDVTDETKSLGDVLNICIIHTQSGNTLYNGSFNGISDEGYVIGLVADDSTETVATYLIEVSLPFSTGNEYQNSLLKADFNWLVPNPEPLDPPPQTGDDGIVYILTAFAVVSLTAVLVLAFSRRKLRGEAE